MSSSGTDGRRLAELMIATGRKLGRTSSRARTGELSNARYELLHTVLHRGPEPMRRVAAALGVTPRSLTDMVDALEADGYLRRVPDPDDRRSVRLELTASGLRLLKGVRHQRLAAGAAVFDVLDDRERAELAAILTKLTDGEPTGPGRR
jgi:DNA-binding MarR family transcriptional regulator